MFRQLALEHGRLDGLALRAAVQAPLVTAHDPLALYDILFAYYQNNDLYDALTYVLREEGVAPSAQRELRNPANRVVSFYTGKLWPGMLPRALPIQTANARIIDPIHKIWAWSNFSAKKQLAARWFAMMGDLFIKVGERDSSDGTERRVMLQVLDPRHVTDFDADERGVVTYARIDVPQRDRRLAVGLFTGRERIDEVEVTHTEVWDTKRVRIYRYDGTPKKSLDLLGVPTNGPEGAEHGLDFVPLVWAPFYDVGERRGAGSFTHALTKIDEANRMATRLHQLLFRHNDVTWALMAKQIDATGRPLPPPMIRNGDNEAVVELGGEKMVRLPGMSELQPLIPKLDYNAARMILSDHLDELRNELPELRYFDQAAKSHVSGSALRTVMGDAADRVTEARGNGELALARADSMALTIAQRAKLKGFGADQIGTYGNGDFEHRYAERDVFPLTPQESATTVQMWTGMGIPLPAALAHEGWTADEVAAVEKAQDEAIKRDLKIQKQQAEAATKLPLTEQLIADIAGAYGKAGIAPEFVLPRLGWTQAEVDAWKAAQEKATQEQQDKAKAEQEEQQAKTLELQAAQMQQQAAIGLEVDKQKAELGLEIQAKQQAQQPPKPPVVGPPANAPTGAPKPAAPAPSAADGKAVP